MLPESPTPLIRIDPRIPPQPLRPIHIAGTVDLSPVFFGSLVMAFPDRPCLRKRADAVRVRYAAQGDIFGGQATRSRRIYENCSVVNRTGQSESGADRRTAAGPARG